MLTPIAPERLPPVSEDEGARGVQIIERGFWMQRDLEQAATVREACEKQAELVGLITANNAGPERD